MHIFVLTSFVFYFLIKLSKRELLRSRVFMASYSIKLLSPEWLELSGGKWFCSCWRKIPPAGLRRASQRGRRQAAVLFTGSNPEVNGRDEPCFTAEKDIFVLFFWKPKPRTASVAGRVNKWSFKCFPNRARRHIGDYWGTVSRRFICVVLWRMVCIFQYLCAPEASPRFNGNIHLRQSGRPAGRATEPVACSKSFTAEWTFFFGGGWRGEGGGWGGFFFSLFFLRELCLEILSWESRQEKVILQVPLSESVFKTLRVWSSSTAAATLVGSQVAAGR